ncbi:hypothetical protein HYFRA_00014032 [Hymenoscyphus fraxineus]|uniref:Peptidase S8/S53 domain-containing protein n=1 Tax=Hymenoscyphus fraxineus TaxID=746836 RepID=A0A9N9Q1P9_9HELO|nr:hypothetical protein HYFRA_00014032 [Hymenoscyphus fraxineus]
MLLPNMPFIDDLELAISSTAKLKGFARSLSKTQRSVSNTPQRRHTPHGSKQQIPFLGKLANRLHVVQDWLKSLDGSQQTTRNPTIVTLLNNLNKLCVRPRSQRDSINGYDGLRNLRNLEDTRLATIAGAISPAAERRRQDLLRILDQVSLAPSTGLRETFDGSEVQEEASDLWFPKRLDSLYTVLQLNRSYGSVEPACSGKLVARMCLSNSKIVDKKCLLVDMLLASSVDGGSACASRWKEAQIRVLPKKAQVHIVHETQSASYSTQNNVDAEHRNVGSQLSTNAFHQMLQDDGSHCLQFQIQERNLVFEQGLPKNVNNYTIMNMPSVCLNEILRPDLMSPRKRLYVSHLLIQAFWQCYGSKWMDDAWTNLRIHFMYTFKNLKPQLFAHEPFLTTDFAEHEQIVLSRNALIPSKVRALGILLLELELGTTIESHWPDAFLNAEGKPNAFTNLSTAQSLVPEKPEEDTELKKRETYAVLREVIRKCLYVTDFNNDQNHQNRDHQRNLIFREILTPIQGILTAIGGDCEEIRFQPLCLQSLASLKQTTERTIVPSVAPSSFTGLNVSESYHGGRRGQAEAKLFDCLHACTEEEGLAADKWLDNVDKIRTDCFDPMLIRTRIKIAILDTGIDYDHTFFSDEDKMPRLVARESFLDCSDPKSVKDVPRNTKDTHGHGSHIAGIILQVAPDTDLYIGRVVRGEEPTQHDAQQISKGIRWAISQGVDIITMSLGFSHSQGEIREAITQAYAKNILVFASASNSGANPIHPIAYPARMATVFCISATDALGNKLLTTPPAQTGKENFSIIAAGIKSAWISERMERKSGTSFATPIAAGLAALALEYANQRRTATPGVFSVQDLKTLHTRDGMATILKRMGEPEMGFFRFLRPWVLWGDESERRPHDRVIATIKESLEGI